MSSEAIAASGSVSSAQQPQERLQSETAAAQKLSDVQNLERVQQAQEVKEATDVNAEPTVEELENAVNQINDLMKNGQRAVAFNLDQDSGQVVVKVTNTQTDELIRQIPNEDALKFAQNIESMMGLIFNDKA